MKALLTLLFLPCLVFADAATDRDGGGFLGGGLGMGQSIFNLGNGSTPSKFSDQGYVFEGGMSMPVGSRFGAQISGEFGQSNATNTFSSQSYLETGTLKYYSAKAGLFYGPITLGAGYRHNDILIKSLASQPANYLESNYSGWNSMLFGAYSLDIKKRFRATIEAQYVSGKLTGSAPSTGTVQFNETSVSLRFFFLFD